MTSQKAAPLSFTKHIKGLGFNPYETLVVIMFVLGPILAVVPLLVVARFTIPDKASLINEFKVFASKMFSSRRTCRFCRGIPCKKCTLLGRAYTNVFADFNLLRFTTKDFYSLAEATNAFGDKFMLKGEFGCWQCTGATASSPKRVEGALRLKASLDGFLKSDASKLRFVRACYVALALYLFLK